MAIRFESRSTPNVRIRFATPTDAGFVAQIENDADLKRFVRESGKSEEDYRQAFERGGDFRFLIVEFSATGAAIGTCGLLTGSDSGECELRIILTKAYWGRGLGIEIGRELIELATGLYPDKVLTAKIHPENIGSLSVARKLGLTEMRTVPSGQYKGWLQFCTRAEKRTPE